MQVANAQATPAEVIGAMRIPSAQIDTMLRETLEQLGDAVLRQRLDTDRPFQVRAVDLTQNIVLSTTLADVLLPEEPFEDMVRGMHFSSGDPDLARIGHSMVDSIEDLDVFTVSANVQLMRKARFDAVRAAI